MKIINEDNLKDAVAYLRDAERLRGLVQVLLRDSMPVSCIRISVDSYQEFLPSMEGVPDITIKQELADFLKTQIQRLKDEAEFLVKNAVEVE